MCITGNEQGKFSPTTGKGQNRADPQRFPWSAKEEEEKLITENEQITDIEEITDTEHDKHSVVLSVYMGVLFDEVNHSFDLNVVSTWTVEVFWVKVGVVVGVVWVRLGCFQWKKGWSGLG